MIYVAYNTRQNMINDSVIPMANSIGTHFGDLYASAVGNGVVEVDMVC